MLTKYPVDAWRAFSCVKTKDIGFIKVESKSNRLMDRIRVRVLSSSCKSGKIQE